jgi:hypothetical protein
LNDAKQLMKKLNYKLICHIEAIKYIQEELDNANVSIKEVVSVTDAISDILTELEQKLKEE